MRTIYVDGDNHAHAENGAGRVVYDTDAFDGMEAPIIACYCYFPANGERPERIQAWKPYEEIHYTELECANDRLPVITAQLAHEREQLASLQEENAALLDDMARMVDEVYQSDLEMMGV